MTTNEVERRLRAAYGAAEVLVVGSAGQIANAAGPPAAISVARQSEMIFAVSPSALGGRRSGWLAPVAAAAAVVVIGGIGATVVQGNRGNSQGLVGVGASNTSAHTNSTGPAPSAVQAIDTGPADPKPGISYPLRVYTHCGFRSVTFGGRSWHAVEPIPDVPQRRPDVAGIASDSNYMLGDATLMTENSLQFTVDDTTVLVPGVVVDFAPDAPGSYPQICA